jgi:DNA-binding NtrC family response regulator
MNKTALIVDDCLDTTKITSFFLKKLGVTKVFIAHSQEDFFSLWDEVRPDFIITDWNISKDFKGDKIIAEASAYKIPVALVTSEEKDSIFEAIAENYYTTFSFLPKPLNLMTLKSWLDEII